MKKFLKKIKTFEKNPQKCQQKTNFCHTLSPVFEKNPHMSEAKLSKV